MQNMGTLFRVAQVLFMYGIHTLNETNYEMYSFEAYIVANIFPFYV